MGSCFPTLKRGANERCASGADDGSEGCLMEKQKDGGEAVRLPSREPRRFLDDGDAVTFRAYAARDGCRIGFGACTGTILETD